MNNQPLTPEQRQFAEDNHDIISSFLRWKRLNQDYYDIVVFGYLRAVRNYFERSELRQYAFKTIAYYAMNSDLYNHYRKQYRQKRTAYVMSLDTAAYADEPLMLFETIAASDADIDTGLLLSELTENLSQEQMTVLRMKSDGYSDREIAEQYGVPVRSVKEILSSVREKFTPSLV
jgi:RNA polymerase sigma-70 factor (ECF subfamily)